MVDVSLPQSRQLPTRGRAKFNSFFSIFSCLLPSDVELFLDLSILCSTSGRLSFLSGSIILLISPILLLIQQFIFVAAAADDDDDDGVGLW